MVVSPKQTEIEYAEIERQREDKSRKVKQGGTWKIMGTIWGWTANTKG